MTPERYTEILEEQVPSWVVSAFGSWPVEMRLYMYLHHLQLAQMDEFKKSISDLKFSLGLKE